jgi:HSP90 family molecular chaperone
MMLFINAFHANNEFYFKNSSQTAQMYVTKLDINHLKIEEVLWRTKELKIDILLDKENKRISITEAGIGITRAQLISNLVTISRSGTRQFMKEIEEGTDLSLIR